MELVKVSLFSIGAGRYENYDCCSWETLGKGQFRPLKGSRPFIGSEGQIEKVPEYKVEMLCAENLVPAAIQAIKENHPYEEPAYEVYPIII